MSFKQFYMTEQYFDTFHHDQWGTSVKIYKSPKPDEIMSIVKNSKANSVRVFSENSKTWYAWDAYEFTHQTIARYLGMDDWQDGCMLCYNGDSLRLEWGKPDMKAPGWIKMFKGLRVNDIDDGFF